MIIVFVVINIIALLMAYEPSLKCKRGFCFLEYNTKERHKHRKRIKWKSCITHQK